MLTTPRDKVRFAIGLLWLLLAGLSFAARNSRYGGTWTHYVWILFGIGSAAWFWRAFKPAAEKPQ